MSWLEEAKGRCWRVSPGPWMEPPAEVYHIVNADCPKAYALLEKAKEIMRDQIGRCACGLLSGCAVCRAPRQWLRDLEGKEPPA